MVMAVLVRQKIELDVRRVPLRVNALSSFEGVSPVISPDVTSKIAKLRRPTSRRQSVGIVGHHATLWPSGDHAG